MLRSYRTQTALLLGLIVALGSGCGQTTVESTAQAAEPTPIAISDAPGVDSTKAAAPKTPAVEVAQAPVPKSPVAEPTPVVASATGAEPAPVFEPAPALEPTAPVAAEPAAAAPEAPPTIAGDRVLTAPATEAAPAAEVSDLPAVAIGDRTIINQGLPQELQDKWRDKVSAMTKRRSGAPAGFRIVDSAADADWIIQVAAIERPDVVYLVPTKKIVETVDDDYFRMSPPGDAASSWLRLELNNLASTTQLVKLLSANAAASDAADAQQAAAAPEGLLPQPSGSGPAAPSSSEPSGGSAPFPSFGLDKSMMRSIFTREGPAEDLKAAVVQEQSGIYHTANRTQALLGTYGKMIPGNKFLGRPAKYEQRTVMQEIDSVRRFTTLDRQGRGSGSDFVSFVGSTRQAWQVIDLAGQVGGGRTNEISFEIVGVRLDQSDAIKALNEDAEALNYFDYLQRNREVPCLILENLVFTSYSATQGTSLNLGGSAKTVITGDGGGAEFDTERSTSNQFASPIVRGYQMYQVRLNRGQVVDLEFVDP